MASPNIYAVPILAATIPATNALDLFWIAAADDRPISIVGLTIDNVGVAADAGDAQEELLSVSIYRGFTTVGSGGSSATASNVHARGVAAGFTARVMDTTVATTSGVAIIPLGWNVRVPMREFWPLELCANADQANTSLVVRLAAGGADTILINGCLWVAEG